MGKSLNLVRNSSISALGSSTTSGTITIPTGRGRVVAYDIKAVNDTVATIDGCTITLNANGVNFLEGAPLAKYSPLYTNKDTIVPVSIDEGATVGYSIVNDQGTAIPVYIEFFFAMN